MFSGCTVLSGSKETEIGSSDQGSSPSAGKNTRVVLVPCGTWKCVTTGISGGVNISEVSGCHMDVTFVRLVSHELTAYLSVFDLISTP